MGGKGQDDGRTGFCRIKGRFRREMPRYRVESLYLFSGLPGAANEGAAFPLIQAIAVSALIS